MLQIAKRITIIMRRSEAGVTLLEILVAMVILGLLATLGSLQLMGYLSRAKADTAKLQISELGVAIETFQLDVGRPPTTQEGLISLIEKPADLRGWRGPYIRKDALLRDPWARKYDYKAPGDDAPYEITSFGSDGKPGGENDAADIRN